jgi:flagellin
MSMRIQTNVDAFRAYRHLDANTNQVSKSIEKLSSGFRINRAADDAAGLAISERLKAQVNGLDQASRNVADGVSLVQTAEGALDQVHAMLQRTRELAVKYANETLSASDKAAITAEAAALSAEVARIGTDTEFNGIAVMNSSTAIAIQVGANDGQTIDVTPTQLSTEVAGGVFDIDTNGSGAIASIDAAIQNVSTARAGLGAVQNRLEYTSTQLGIYQENLTSSLSRVRDTDMASEMVKFTKLQIMQQAGTAMLAQANTAPQSVLALLR